MAQQVSAQVRVMPLGDSLTSSLDGHASYRYWLWQKLLANGRYVDLVGTLWGVGDGASANPGDFDQNHEGHPGATTDDILYGIENWASSAQPDIVLLLIGANDLEHGASPSRTVANTRRIVETLRSVNPRVAVIVAMLPPIRGQQKQEQAYNSALVKVAPRWSKPGSPVKIVNLWSNYSPARDTFDGQHPSVSGEKKIANRFFNPLMSLLSRY